MPRKATANKQATRPDANEFTTTHEIPRIADRSELPTHLGADAEVVFVAALEDLVGRIGAEQPGPIDRDLIAGTEAVLRVLGADAVVLEGLHHGHLEDELLI